MMQIKKPEQTKTYSIKTTCTEVEWVTANYYLVLTNISFNVASAFRLQQALHKYKKMNVPRHAIVLYKFEA